MEERQLEFCRDLLRGPICVEVLRKWGKKLPAAQVPSLDQHPDLSPRTGQCPAFATSVALGSLAGVVGQEDVTGGGSKRGQDDSAFWVLPRRAAW